VASSTTRSFFMMISIPARSSIIVWRSTNKR
jgi:hypothetical protein